MKQINLTFLMCLVGWVDSEIFPRPNQENEFDPDYWLKLGKQDIKEALERPVINKVAKNVILFLGDGMGITVSTAGRILKGQKQGYSGEEGYLVWDRFPNVGLMKTYNLDKQVADSAGTGTAYLCGVKGNYETVGLTGRVMVNDCQGSLEERNRLPSIMKWAQDAGKDTGLVTTARVTHATPSASYAKSPQRDWECDTEMMEFDESAMACKDIARQLVEDEPGKNINVIMGGGRQVMGAQESEDAEPKCVRSDNRDLVEEWEDDKENRGMSHEYVTNTEELREIDVDETDFIMGLFDDFHMPYEVDRNTSLEGSPNLIEMTHVAIERLKRSENGFFLLVEAAHIDKGLHLTKPRKSLEELLVFEKAVEMALKMVDIEETLIIVTADHSHSMSFSGYPPRGNNILGVVTESVDISDGLPYTTLGFVNGYDFSNSYSWNGEEVVRRNLTGVDTTDKDFVFPAGIPTYYDSETHGGEDVAAFALGPMSHLFHRVHEQSYVAHVMGYAACIGPYEDCDRPANIPANAYTVIQSEIREKLRGGSSTVTCSSIGMILLISIYILNTLNLLDA